MAEGPKRSRVLVPAARIPRWLAGFAARNDPDGPGQPVTTPVADGWQVSAGSATALIHAPRWPGTEFAAAADLGPAAGRLRYAVLVVRRAGYLVAVIEDGVLRSGRASGRHIHGRTAAGGWSQQRYARRRSNQADEICASAAQELLAQAGGQHLQFLATGGDRALLADALAAIPAGSQAADLPAGPHFEIGTPTKADLHNLHDRVTAVAIEV